jgi:hypothetical protein
MGRMSPAVENSARPEDQAVANDYDSFAEAYAAEAESSLINGYYTRPAILGPRQPDEMGESTRDACRVVGCDRGVRRRQ